MSTCTVKMRACAPCRDEDDAVWSGHTCHWPDGTSPAVDCARREIEQAPLPYDGEPVPIMRDSPLY